MALTLGRHSSQALGALDELRGIPVELARLAQPNGAIRIVRSVRAKRGKSHARPRGTCFAMVIAAIAVGQPP